ncbi:hypothetical protein IWW36_001817 [Coemansia brasiliensis]|uniref:HECT-type E3 ubiquitin transferase n=1 Tax=Coemansia brasiliensis TaxID=2650707 RepID=A0A9W8I8A9_9FUNG|nr:hypothetical protein IWW36_001817 [Coemansia brasiliensis]
MRSEIRRSNLHEVKDAQAATDVLPYEAWPGWADMAARDESLRQALKSTVLRPLLQPATLWTGKAAVRASSRSASKPRALSRTPSISTRRHHPAVARMEQLQACFLRQMQHGCTLGGCQMRLCAGNSKYAERLQQMSPESLMAVATELARQAMENPTKAELQPHSEQVLRSGECTSRAGATTTFASAFAQSMQRLLATHAGDSYSTTARRFSGQHTVSAARAASVSMRDDADGLALGVSRLDAQTAPLVAAIGGRLLRNTVELAFGSPQALSKCFSTASSHPLSLDIVAATEFLERIKSPSEMLHALRRSLSAIEGAQQELQQMDEETDSRKQRALALSVLALGVVGGRVPAEDAAAQRRQLTRLLINSAFTTQPTAEKHEQWGWFARFTYDSEVRQQWLRWWAQVPTGIAKWWVQGLKEDAAGAIGRLLSGLTSDRVVSQQVDKDPVRWAGALELLRLLKQATVGRLDDSEFVSTAILKHFDLVRELQRWMDSQRKQRGGERHLFGPFWYPFLFSLADKRRLMRTEAYERMRHWYLSSHDRQAELLQSQRMLNIDTQAEQVVRSGMVPGWPLLTANQAAVSQASNPYLVLSVRRSRLVQDVVDMVQAGTGREQFPLKVRFVGSGEDGVDMGGVQKELFAVLIPRLLNPEHGLFELTEGGFLWPNAASPCELSDFEAVGVLLGLAFFNGIVLDSEAAASLSPLLVRQLAFDDRCRHISEASLSLLLTVEPTFPELAAGLRQLLEWDEGNGKIEDVFCRAFEVTVSDPLQIWAQHAADGSSRCETVRGLRAPRIDTPGTATFELVSGGSNIEVTDANRHEYVRRHIEFVAFEYVRAQIDALRSGFMRAGDGVIYRMLSGAELEQWLCASAPDVSAVELERIAQYEDEYTADHPVVRRFWRVVYGLLPVQLRQLLAFVTASDRVPPGGYTHITFVVQRNGPDTDRLPTALTCFGRLLLPAYATDEKMRERLVTAIENASGFGLV